MTRIWLLLLLAMPAFADWEWKKTPVPLALEVDGIWYESFHLDAALDKAGTRQRNELKDLSRYSVVVLVNASVSRVPKAAQEEIREFVRNGGGLVVLGGFGAYYNGGYGGTPLEEVLPVDLKDSYIDLYIIAEKGAKLARADTADWPARFDFKAGPLAYYFHTLAPKPGAKVQIKVGDQPAFVTGTFGKGRVVACSLTVNGNPQPGALPFWQWKDWPALLGQAIEWAGAERPAGTVPLVVPAPKIPVEKNKDLLAIDATNSVAYLKTRYEDALKPARLPDEHWAPLEFADATPVAAHAAIAAYRLGDPEAVPRLCALFRTLNVYEPILWNASLRSTPARLRAQTMDVAWEFLIANVAPIPDSQATAFIKAAVGADDPVTVEFLADILERSAGKLSKADWKALDQAKSQILVKMGLNLR